MEMAQVLVVDDERNIRTLVSRVLVALGYQVTEADNGVTALSHIRDNPPDLVFTDLSMPKMNGMQLIDKVKREFPELPIIVISAYTEQLREARQKGIDHSLPKPFVYHELIEMVDRVLPLPEDTRAV
jgi:CheY-like chemotaxis protein